MHRNILTAICKQRIAEQIFKAIQPIAIEQFNGALAGAIWDVDDLGLPWRRAWKLLDFVLQFLCGRV